MVTERKLHSDLAIPPGEYLEEVLQELGMSKTELAKRMGRPAPKLSAIFTGAKSITPATAMQLEKVVGVPANIWLGLETEYRLARAEQQEKDQLAQEVKLLTPFCYSKLAQLGLVRKVTHRHEKVRELQRFFGVASLAYVCQLRRYQAAFRVGRGGVRSPSPYALASWLRVGEIQARGVECNPFDRSRLKNALDRIRQMTLRTPEEFQEPLASLLASCGVALIIVPHFPGTKAHGATFWLEADKAVLMLTIRGRWADVFWFSLFHELGHILLHQRGETFIEGDPSQAGQEGQEEEADRFTADQLVPPSAYKHFVGRGDFYPDSIAAFARQIGIDAGVVVGRLQHDGYLPWKWGNKLRTHYSWAHTALDK